MPSAPIDLPIHNEEHSSHLPALQLLSHLGYSYLPPSRVNELRLHNMRNVLLEPIIRQWLLQHNKLETNGQEHPPTDAMLNKLMRRLRDTQHKDGPKAANKALYELITMPVSEADPTLGTTNSFSLKYIDWHNPANNVYHLVEEFSVTRHGRNDSYRPDLVLFVNGIPLVVIECKSGVGNDNVEAAISQHNRNQQEDGIGHLYLYAALVLALARSEARYGTAYTRTEQYARWRETHSPEDQALLKQLVSKPLAPELVALVSEEHAVRDIKHFQVTVHEQRLVTEQDKLLFDLCRPARLLEMIRNFTVFDKDVRKLARYQQYFVIKAAVARAQNLNATGKRQGGVVWHTQGSGKSLTMVMLAEHLARMLQGQQYTLIVVTDRTDLDKQIEGTLRQTGARVVQATTGRHLIKLLNEQGGKVITTLVHKFETAQAEGLYSDSPNVFLLIDEAHRTQYGKHAARMEQVFPNACIFAFTGTPLFKKDKKTADKFGGMINPVYSIAQAVEDKAVVPLLYEGRFIELDVNKKPMDQAFDQMAEPLTEYGKGQLAKKYASEVSIIESDAFIDKVVQQVTDHLRNNIALPFKGQLVATSKYAAVKYYNAFKLAYAADKNKPNPVLVISGADTREGENDPHESSKKEVITFYKDMMAKYGNQVNYEDKCIADFRSSNEDSPRLLIVVDKLLTGFDAPFNQVLYLARKLKDHSLLQAIARVNRLATGKDYGYIIDFVGNLSNMGQALNLYANLTEGDNAFDLADIEGTFTVLEEQAQRIKQDHSNLWDLFKTIKNKTDLEEYERYLAAEDIRQEFYGKLSQYARTLNLCFSSIEWLNKTALAEQQQYKSALKFFMNLRNSVKIRYADDADFKQYEDQIKHIINRYVQQTGEVHQLTEQPVNIFDPEALNQALQRNELSDASKADRIASETQKKLDLLKVEDPALAKRLSELLIDTINQFRSNRIDELSYLSKVKELAEELQNRGARTLPAALNNHNNAAIFRQLGASAKDKGHWSNLTENDLVELAVYIDQAIQDVVIIDGQRRVDWQDKEAIKREVLRNINDCLFDFQDKTNSISDDEIEGLAVQFLAIAIHNY